MGREARSRFFSGSHLVLIFHVRYPEPLRTRKSNRPQFWNARFSVAWALSSAVVVRVTAFDTKLRASEDTSHLVGEELALPVLYYPLEYRRSREWRAGSLCRRVRGERCWHRLVGEDPVHEPLTVCSSVSVVSIFLGRLLLSPVTTIRYCAFRDEACPSSCKTLTRRSVGRRTSCRAVSCPFFALGGRVHKGAG